MKRMKLFMVISAVLTVVAGWCGKNPFAHVRPDSLLTACLGSPYSQTLRAYDPDDMPISATWSMAPYSARKTGSSTYVWLSGSAQPVPGGNFRSEGEVFNLPVPFSLNGESYSKVRLFDDRLDFEQDEFNVVRVRTGMYNLGSDTLEGVWYAYNGSTGDITFWWEVSRDSIPVARYSATLSTHTGLITVRYDADCCSGLDSMDAGMSCFLDDARSSYMLFAESNGSEDTSDLVFAPGELPPGLTLSSAGVLSGTPSATGTYMIPVLAEPTFATLKSVSPKNLKASSARAFFFKQYELQVVDPAHMPPQIIAVTPEGGEGTYYDEPAVSMSVTVAASDTPLFYRWFAKGWNYELEEEVVTELTPEALAEMNGSIAGARDLDFDLLTVNGGSLTFVNFMEALGDSKFGMNPAPFEFFCVVSNSNGSARQNFTLVYAPPVGYPRILSESPANGYCSWRGEPLTLGVVATSPDASPLSYRWAMGVLDYALGRKVFREFTPTALANYNSRYRAALGVDHDVVTVNGSSLTLAAEFSEEGSVDFICYVTNARGTVYNRFIVTMPVEDLPQFTSVVPESGKALFDGTSSVGLVAEATSPNGSPVSYEWYYGKWNSNYSWFDYTKLTPSALAEMNANLRAELGIGYDVISVAGGSMVMERALLSHVLDVDVEMSILCYAVNNKGSTMKEFSILSDSIVPVIDSVKPSSGMIEVGCEPVTLEVDWSIAHPVLNDAQIKWEYSWAGESGPWHSPFAAFSPTSDYSAEFAAEENRLYLSAPFVASRPIDSVLYLRATVSNTAEPTMTASTIFRVKRVSENDFSFTGVAVDPLYQGKGARVTGYSASIPLTAPFSVTMPCSVSTEVGTLTVREVGDGLFEDLDQMVSCALPRSLREIGDSAFSGCTRLAEVTGLENVAEIQPYAFYSCAALAEINLSRALETIGSFAFAGCSSLRRVWMHCDAAPEVDATAFQGVAAGATVYVPMGSTGWDGTPGSTVLPATWQGMALRTYDPTLGKIPLKAVLTDGGSTLRFLCDYESHGVEGVDWFSVDRAISADSKYDIPWRGVRDTVTRVVFDKSFGEWFQGNSTAWWFSDFTRLTSVLHLRYLDTSNVTRMTGMFSGCSTLPLLDLSSFDTHRVADMSEMFRNCGQLKCICASDSFSTDAVTDSGSMFYGCYVLKGGDGQTYNSAIVDARFAYVGTSSTHNGYFHGPRTAKVVREESGKVLRFVYDCVDHGARNTDWFDIEASLTPNPHGTKPWRVSSEISKVVIDPSFADYFPRSTAAWFQGISLRGFEGLFNINMSEVEDACQMFQCCSVISSIDLHGMDFSNVALATNMFNGCGSLRTLYSDGGQVFSATANTGGMFRDCPNLKGENGTDYSTSHLDAEYARLDLPGQRGYFTAWKMPYAEWNASSSTLTFRYDGDYEEWNPCQRSWDEIVFESDQADNNWSFWRNAELPTACTRAVIAPSLLDFHPTSCRGLFSSLSHLQEIEGLGNLDTADVRDMARMFECCNALATVDLTGFSTSSVTNMCSMFDYCRALTKIDLTSFFTSKVTDMRYMFRGCNQVTEIDATGNFTVNSVDRSTGMFSGCTSLRGGLGTAYNSAKTDRELAKVDKHLTQSPGYFTAACVPYAKFQSNRLYFRYDSNSGNVPTHWLTNGFCNIGRRWGGNDGSSTCKEVVIEPSMTNWHPRCCTGLFSRLTAVTNYVGFQYLDTSRCTSMDYMFEHNEALKSIDLSCLDTSRVKNMASMFANSRNLAHVDFGDVDTSSVTNMSYMFSYCSKLQSVDALGLDTSHVKLMSGMFNFCSKLAELDLSGFRTPDLRYTSSMFSSCGSLTSIYVSSAFSMASVTSHSAMFHNCTNLVGGAGTVYDSAHRDGAYARIDAPGVPGYFTYRAWTPAGGYAAWAAEKGLTGVDAPCDAKPAKWGGTWANAFVYTFGEGLVDGSVQIMAISFDSNGRPVITTAPVVDGHDDFTAQVVGSSTLTDWSSPVVLERNGNSWTLPVGQTANFFRVRLSE